MRRRQAARTAAASFPCIVRPKPGLGRKRGMVGRTVAPDNFRGRTSPKAASASRKYDVFTPGAFAYTAAMDWIVSLPDRLDAFLAADGRMLSRVKAQKAIDEGRVAVNGAVVTRQSHRVQEGDRVSLTEDAADAPAANDSIAPTDLHLEILHDDKSCIVINKPAGIAVHPGAGMAPNEPTILHGVAHLFRKKKIRFSPDSVLVHRLDKDTTGCLLVAKTAAAHRFLQEQFETRTVKKTYLALVAGVPEHAVATVDAPIGRSVGNRTKMSVRASLTSREAQTTYRVVGSAKNIALLECDLHTGRTHQIRVHLQSIGHPVLGDSSYTNSLSQRLAQEFDIRGVCLHSWKLAFASPEKKKECAIEAPLPRDFARALEMVGISRDGR